MPKRKTLGQIMEDKYTACRSAGIDITESYERAAAAVEREVLRRLDVKGEKLLRSMRPKKKGKP